MRDKELKKSCRRAKWNQNRGGDRLAYMVVLNTNGSSEILGGTIAFFNKYSFQKIIGGTLVFFFKYSEKILGGTLMFFGKNRFKKS